MRFIFDLDGTVIESTHRQGDTLDDWRRLNTARNVALHRTIALADFSNCTCSRITLILSATLGRDFAKRQSCLMVTRASKIL